MSKKSAPWLRKSFFKDALLQGEMASKLIRTLTHRLNDSQAFFSAVDGSVDISDSDQVAIFIRRNTIFCDC